MRLKILVKHTVIWLFDQINNKKQRTISQDIISTGAVHKLRTTFLANF